MKTEVEDLGYKYERRAHASSGSSGLTASCGLGRALASQWYPSDGTRALALAADDEPVDAEEVAGAAGHHATMPGGVEARDAVVEEEPQAD